MVIGVLLLPVLPYLVNGEISNDINLRGLYLIYLANAAISYFMYAYMSSLIVVYQREDINSKTNLVLTLFLTLGQIIILYTTKNYYLFTQEGLQAPNRKEKLEKLYEGIMVERYTPLEKYFAVLIFKILPLTTVPVGRITLEPEICSFNKVATKESPELPENVLTGCRNSNWNTVPAGILFVFAVAL